MIRSFLETQESIGNSLINTRRWAMDKANKEFKEKYENYVDWNKLYEPSSISPHSDGRALSWTLKEEFNDIYWGMVDEFENELLEYKNDEYDT